MKGVGRCAANDDGIAAKLGLAVRNDATMEFRPLIDSLRPRCPECDYDLEGLPDAHRCPECGKYYDRSNLYARILTQNGPVAFLRILFFVAPVASGLFVFVSARNGADWAAYLFQSPSLLLFVLIAYVTAAYCMTRRLRYRRQGRILLNQERIRIEIPMKPVLEIPWEAIREIRWSITWGRTKIVGANGKTLWSFTDVALGDHNQALQIDSDLCRFFKLSREGALDTVISSMLGTDYRRIEGQRQSAYLSGQTESVAQQDAARRME